ncbi:MAG: TlpA family protein disulfide reductase [Planctomycetes bacterium]|nr:TlpA family protein disulfide reductase [Planctomycetota bacterium]
MFRIVFLLAALAASSALTAQSTLAELQRLFERERQGLTSGDREQGERLLADHVKRLAAFVARDAKDDDRWNGRLMLADLAMAKGDPAAAAGALKEIDTAAAPALLLVTAATFAQRLGLLELRGQWIRAAIDKPAPLQDRLAMARLLMVVLHEVERGETIFAEALAAAATDEDKALVRWHRADALRDREDLPDNAAYDELEKLAADLPRTYWGSVAKDRLRVTSLRVGDDAIPFRATTREHGEIVSSDQRGKAILLVFWQADDRDLPRLVEMIAQMKKNAGDRLLVLGVSLDRDVATIEAAVKGVGITFPVVGDGKGTQGDVALRWFAEGPVVHVIDGRGKMAGIGLHAGTADGRAELVEVVERATRP